jgi:hypothetical protein
MIMHLFLSLHRVGTLHVVGFTLREALQGLMIGGFTKCIRAKGKMIH